MQSIRHILTFATLLTGLCCSAGASALTLQEICEKQMPQMDVTLSFPRLGYVVDNSVSYKRFPENVEKRSDQEGIGLTVLDYRVGYSFDAQKKEDRRALVECVTAKINVEVTAQPLHVYVGSEFSPGTCGYNEVLAHEMRHVATYQAHFRNIEQVLRGELNKRFHNSSPVYGQLNLAMVSLEEDLRNKWVPYIDSLVSYGSQLHNVIDTEDETIRISRACNGDIQKVMRATNGLGSKAY